MYVCGLYIISLSHHHNILDVNALSERVMQFSAILCKLLSKIEMFVSHFDIGSWLRATFRTCWFNLSYTGNEIEYGCTTIGYKIVSSHLGNIIIMQTGFRYVY